jgi:hypothetical protein
MSLNSVIILHSELCYMIIGFVKLIPYFLTHILYNISLLVKDRGYEFQIYFTSCIKFYIFILIYIVEELWAIVKHDFFIEY